MNHTDLKIELKPGSEAPRYTEERKSLEIEKVVITEQGMQSGMPLVDFQMRGHDGKTFWLAMTGNLAIALASAIRGVIDRNHEVTDDKPMHTH